MDGSIIIDFSILFIFSNETTTSLLTGSQERLQQFDLTVYNTSDNEILCGYHRDIINTYNTVTCNRPVIGRYVHFKRKGGPEISQTALCEGVIIGHKYIGNMLLSSITLHYKYILLTFSVNVNLLKIMQIVLMKCTLFTVLYKIM